MIYYRKNNIGDIFKINTDLGVCMMITLPNYIEVYEVDSWDEVRFKNYQEADRTEFRQMFDKILINLGEKMKEITLWYRWAKDKWEYITYTEGWSDEKVYVPPTPYSTPYRFAKEFAYLSGNQVIYNVD